MALSTLAETHILCVLHTNPGSDKARGHLGSSLQRKAETVLFVHRVGETSVVEPQFCRNEPFERFAFSINEAGIPEVCPLPMEGGTSDRHPAVALLEDEYGGAIERTTLIRKLTETQGIKQHAAAMQVQRLIGRGSLVADGRMVQLPEITKSRNHAITGGGGDVINVIKCDKSETKETSEPTPSDVPTRETETAPETATPSETTPETATTREAAPHTPLWQQIGDMFPEVKPHASDMFPEVKPHASMAAWDDDCAF